MKIFGQWAKTLLAVTIAVTGFTACSNDNENVDKGDRFLTLSINTQGVMRGTTITTDPGTAAEDKINSVTVGIFNDAGDAIKIEEFTGGTLTTTSTGIQVTMTTQGLVAGNKVVVVANAPAGTFNSCPNLNSFKAKTAAIDDALANGTAEKTTGFLMLGNGTVAASTGSVNFTADVTVYHMVAKVTLAPITIDFSGNALYASATFTPEEIFIHNAPATKAFWYTSESGASAYYSGESTAASKKEYLGTGATTIDADKTHYLYTLPNGETGDNATKLIIKGTFKATPSSAGTTIYYPIYLDYNAPATAGDAGTAATGALPGYASEIGLTARTPKVVYANDNYHIAVSIKSIGTTSPDSDLDPQQVQVSITVAPWTDLNQSATFN